MNHDATFFKHRPLPNAHSIRLLRKEPAGPEGILSFSLHTRDLHEPSPAYHCLSYTWGNPFAHGVSFRRSYEDKQAGYGPGCTVPILVDGRRLSVHKNLYDALNVVPKTAYIDDLNRPTADNDQPYLHVVATNAWPGRLQMYIERGANVNAADADGRTALHCAASAGSLDCVKILCQSGAVRKSQGNSGLTAKDEASKLGLSEVVEYLDSLEEEADPLPGVVAFDDHGAGLIWADAICINQEDLDEKSIQVTMMDQVYSLATHVVAWLGPQDENTAEGINTMKLLTRHLPHFEESQIAPYSGTDKDQYEKCGIPLIPASSWTALASILQRQWFRRVWIVQEAVLPLTLIMYIGSDLVPWYDLGKLAEAIRRQEAKLGSTRSTRFEPADSVGVPVEWNMAEMFKWRSNISRARREADPSAKSYADLFVLDNLLSCFWTFKATDARDKIFSLYGLLNRFANSRYGSDYRHSVQTVYTMATRQVLAETGTLDILSQCVYSDDKIAGLPSWVPDYSIGAVNAVPDIFEADKGLEGAKMTIGSLNDPSLCVRGIRLGSVSRANGRIATGASGKFIFDPGWLKLVLSLKNTKGHLSEILWRTLCMDLTYGSFFDHTKYGDKAPNEFGQQFMMFMMLMLLSGADRQTLLKNNMDLKAVGPVSYVDAAYDPFTQDMASVLEDLDAIAAHDGDKNLLPLRAEVLSYWNNVTCALVRSTTVDEDGGPYDFYVPPEVSAGTSRCVGNGTVLTSSRMFRRCLGFANAYQVAYGWRQLFTLDDEFLGLAPVSAQQGDQVWILAGLKAPAVLRQVERGYQFIGSCYIHGLMRGEGIAGLSNELESIELV